MYEAGKAQQRCTPRVQDRRGGYRLRALLLSSVFAANASHAFAKDAAAAAPAAHDSNTIEELIVTATRREEKLSRVPVSVAAFTQETLDKQGAKQIDDIARLTPGLVFTRATGNSAGFTSSVSIRGVASLVGAATTGVYVDDTPVQVRSLLIVSNNTFPKVFDLDRIEVLRGPQGTLFGAGSEGGAIRFITPQPSLGKFSGSARAELGMTDGGRPSYEAGVAVNAPLVDDKLAARASVWYRSDGGWIDRADPNTGKVLHENGNNEQSFAGKLAVSWFVTPELTVTPSVYYQHVHDDERTQFWENISSGSNYREGAQIPEPSTDEFVLPAIHVDYQGANFSVVSNTSYFKRKFESTYDYTINTLSLVGLNNIIPPSGYPGGGDPSISTIEQGNFTQEIRVLSPAGGRLQWVVGAFYSRNNQIGYQHIPASVADAVGRALLGKGYPERFGRPFINGNEIFYTRLTSIEEQKSLFADVTYSITDKLKVNAGVRASEGSFSYYQTTSGPVVAAVPVVSGGEKSEKPITPKFGLSYQLDPNNFFYFTAAKGFRIGGAQPQLIALCNAELASLGFTTSPATYNSDSLWSYEVGSKNAFLGGRVRLEGSAYVIDWSDIQSRIKLNSCGGSVIVGNLGTARSKGFDVSIQAKVGDHATVGGSIGYTDAEYNETIKSNSGSIFSRKGGKIGGPPFNMALFAQYNTDDLLNLPSYVRVDYQYSSAGPKPDPTLYEYDPAIPRTPAAGYLNLRAGVTVKGVDVSAFLNNVTNENAELYRSHRIGSSIYFNTTARPLNGGVTVAYKF